MSHFTVLVIGDDVEKALEPFHEFECTGVDNKYVVEVDITKKALKSYQENTERIIICPDGEKISAYDSRFYRDPTEEETEKMGHIAGTGSGHGMSWTSRDWEDGKGYRTKVRYIPEGHEETDINSQEITSFAEYVTDYYGMKFVKHDEKPDFSDEHKYGYIQLGQNNQVIKVIDRTNPNSKWDWYQVGGRWRGYFPVKFPTSLRDVAVGDSGGVFDKKAESGHADSLRIKDIDFEGKKTKIIEESNKLFDEWEELLEKYDTDHKTIPWSEFVLRVKDEDDSMTIDDAREAYNAQPLFKALSTQEMRENPFGGFYYGCQVEDMGFDRDKYIKSQVESMFVTFALVKDGKWYEKGEMGWWGMTSNEKDQETWNSQFNKLLKELPEDTIVTLIDCHI